MSNKRDALNGDHSFKNWFKIMWKNGYIFLFLVGLSGMIVQLANWGDMIDMISENFSYSTFGGIAAALAMLLPTMITGIVTYKGFIQFWNDLKNGRGR